MIAITLRPATQADVGHFVIVQNLVGIQYAGTIKALTDTGVILDLQQIQDKDGWESASGLHPVSNAQVVEMGTKAQQALLIEQASQNEDRS